MTTDYTQTNTRLNVLITRGFFILSLGLQAAILYSVVRL